MTRPEPEVRYVYKNVLIAPPDNLITNCELQAPPDRKEYLAADWSGKEEQLSDAYRGATEKTILCNVGIEGLRTWKREQLKIYSDPEDKLGK
jgi:hypothetical protein